MEGQIKVTQSDKTKQNRQTTKAKQTRQTNRSTKVRNLKKNKEKEIEGDGYEEEEAIEKGSQT